MAHLIAMPASLWACLVSHRCELRARHVRRACRAAELREPTALADTPSGEYLLV